MDGNGSDWLQDRQTRLHEEAAAECRGEVRFVTGYVKLTGSTETGARSVYMHLLTHRSSFNAPPPIRFIPPNTQL